MTMPALAPIQVSLLSLRERQVLWLKACGRTGEQAGRELHISGQTVKNHMTSIFRKLGACSSEHALALALARAELDLAAPPPEMPPLSPEQQEDRARDACKTCGKPRHEAGHLTHGRCHLCAEYYRRKGSERPGRLYQRAPRRYRGARIPDTD